MKTEVIGDVILHHGDCRDVLGEDTPYKQIDFIFTDSPYGHNNNDGDLISFREAALGQEEKKSWGGDIRNDPRPILNDSPEQTKVLVSWLFNDATKLLVKGGCICCCCSGGGGKDVAMAEWPQMMFAVPHLAFKQVIIWDKGPMGMGWHYRRSYETVLVAQRQGAPCKWYDTTKKVENIIRPGDYGIYKILPVRDQHPTEKPVELAAHFIRLHTQPGELVCDPFMGGGSTGLAAIRSGRKFLGVELEQHWFDVACRKIEAEVLAKESGDDMMETLFG